MYRDTKRSKTFLDKKNVKITKRAHSFKDFASTYHVEVLNSFHCELQLQDTESSIKSRPIDLLTRLKGLNSWHISFSV